MNIRLMKSSDLAFATECATEVGWQTTTLHDFEVSLTYDPNGCFIMEDDGLRLGLCVATNYESFGFIGCLIVVEEVRGRGIGYQLLECAVEYLHKCDNRYVLLDGVPAAISLYERMGFTRVCQSLRFSGVLQGQKSQDVRAIVMEDFEAISKIDRKAFGADRKFFLEHYWRLDPDLGKVLERDGEIAGFILGRQGRDVVWAGPLVVRQGVKGAEELLLCLAAEVGGRPLNIGVLEINIEAVKMVRSVGMVQKRTPSLRMILGGLGNVRISNEYYAISSAARG